MESKYHVGTRSLGGRRIVKTTQLIRKKKVFILICINYMFRPAVAIIRFITDLRGVGVLIKRSLGSIFVILMSGVVTVYSTITIP